jgi:hypothetical protein
MGKRSQFCINLILGIILLIGTMHSQQDSSRQAIVSLVSRFGEAATAGRSLAEFFRPDARSKQEKNLQALSTKSFRHFAIRDFTPSDIEFKDAEHASVRATVEWETSNESASKTTSLDFVNVGGTWYFAKVDFWALSLIWITPFVTYGVAYGVGVTIMLIHMRKVKWPSSRKRFLWECLSLVPGTLPLYFAGRPWLADQTGR